MEEGRQGTEFHEGSGVRLYQQNISVGLDPREVMSQAREFESTLLGQAQAAVQETRNQVSSPSGPESGSRGPSYS